MIEAFTVITARTEAPPVSHSATPPHTQALSNISGNLSWHDREERFMIGVLESAVRLHCCFPLKFVS